METMSCKDCAHYDYAHNKCRLGSNQTDCEDWETNDHYDEEDDED